jgi:hypothetical protein
VSGEVVGYQRRGRRVGSHDWNAWLPCSADAFNQIGANRTIGAFELESRALVLATDYADLQAKLDAVTKDAERYRWLRGDGPFRFVTDFKPFVGKFTGSGFDGLMRDDADAAIDAAMADLTDQGRAGEGR